MKEALPSGSMIARYQVSLCLSAKGVAEVYLAKDTETKRAVVLKVFPSQLIEEPRIRSRFLKIYSGIPSIRHRNLCQTYEGRIGEGDRPYVALEYVKGQSFDRLGARKQMPLKDVTAKALQIAGALSAAHAAGWLHLALKPSNLILTDSGQVMLLDLGQSLAFPPSLTRKVLDPAKTAFGLPYYFSPEQVAGAKTDQRSDVFSLGAILYELLAGRKPFPGVSFDEVSAALQEMRPPLLSELRNDVSYDLVRILAKALAKDLNERYQTIGEMAHDLHRCATLQARQPASLQARQPASLQARQTASLQARQPASIKTEGKTEGKTGGLKARRPTIIEIPRAALPPAAGINVQVKSRVAKLTESLPEFGASWILTWLLLIGIIWGLLLAGKSLVHMILPELRKPLEVTQISSSGRVTNAVLSPAGERLAYTVNEDGRQSVIIREVVTGKERKVAADAAKEYRGLVFSPDGGFLCYIKADPETTLGRLYRLAIATDVEEDLGKGDKVSSVSFSPDGKKIAYLSASDDFSETIVSVDTPVRAGIVLAKRKRPSYFYPRGFVWSPDGRAIACVVKDAGNGLYLKLVALELDSESGESTIAAGRWSEVDQLAWLNDGSGLVVSASEPASRVTQLWRVDYPAGAVTRITHDQYDYHGVSLTSDSSLLMSVRSEVSSNVWVAPGADYDRARQVTTNRCDGVTGVDWTGDARIIYASSAGGHETLWIADINQNQQQELTVAAESGGEREFQPAASPDDNYVAFIVESANGSYLWRADVEGRNLGRLTDENQVFSPSFSADGKNVVYSVLREEQMMIAKSSLEDGVQKTLFGTHVWRPAVSPAGQYIACNYWNEKRANWDIAVFPMEGEKPTLVFDAPGDHRRIVRWIPDGRGLSYLVTRDGVSNLWMQPLDQKPPVQLTKFRTGRIFDFAWSRDGGQLAFARGEVKSDAVFIENFR